MAMQTLVMAHAAFGHNHFFKNNYLFQQWTDADGIQDYLAFAKNYIAACEERYGFDAVEEILDAAHALQSQGVFRYGRPPKPTIEERRAMQQLREAYEKGQCALDIWTDATLGLKRDPDAQDEDLDHSERRKRMNLPQENILYFLEKHSLVGAVAARPAHRADAGAVFLSAKTDQGDEWLATFVHYYIITALMIRVL